MPIARWIPKVTNTHSEYVIFIFHSNNGYADAPECHVVHTSPVLYYTVYIESTRDLGCSM
jgi:hypothetical protein